MPDQPIRQEVVSAGAVRAAYTLGSIGMVTLILALLILTNTRPQGQLRRLDASQHQELLQRAEARLSGFEAVGDGAARLDIEHAMGLVVERGVDLPLVAGGAPPAAVAVDGEPLFATNCAACHQPAGTGIPGAFPPLAEHVSILYEADRTYLPTVLLYGLLGPIEARGLSYNGLMPPFAHLGDEQIAAILNHVLTAWGDDARLGAPLEPFTGAEVEALRGQGLSGPSVHQIRQQLGLP